MGSEAELLRDTIQRQAACIERLEADKKSLDGMVADLERRPDLDSAQTKPPLTKLSDLGIDLDGVADPAIRQVIVLLFNLVEETSLDNDRLRAKVQALLDEVARLKGEQGKPNVRGKTRSDISSEEERKTEPKPRKAKGSKNRRLKVTRTEIVPIDPSTLPADAVPKGYETSIVQELVIIREVIELKRETYYSPSLRRSFTAPMPAGYDGSFGPRLKSIMILLKTLGNMTEPSITELMNNLDVEIGKSSTDRILLKGKQPFHDEKADIVTAGLAATSYQHIDDTGARVRGENHHSHVMCNDYYSAFFTREHKDRLTVLSILSGVDTPDELPQLWNPESSAILSALGWAKKRWPLLESLPQGESLTKAELDQWCAGHGLSKTLTKRLTEAMSIAAYHARTDIPIVPIFMADDAPQFKLLTKELALCWIHDGRHYKKLKPVIPWHRRLLDKFLGDYWGFYHQLLAYKATPTPEAAGRLEQRFIELFSTTTGYARLDDRIAKTKAKQSELLLALAHPELPLHNNPAELGAESQVRKRDVSLHTMTEEGTRVLDTFLTLRETAKKLNVNLYDYLFDRVSRTYAMSSLADIIRERSGQVAAAGP